MGPKILPKGCQFWPELQPNADIAALYNAGFAGAYGEPEEREALIAENIAITGFGSIEEAATANNWAGSGANELSMPFICVLERYPKAWPGPAQPVGDCVGRSTANAGLLSMCCEVAAGKPDEVSGRIETYPDVNAVGERNGVVSAEAIYWWRRHGGHGWSCGAACRVMQRESGLWVRQNYPELGFDLTQYTKASIERYGRTPPTGKVAEQGVKNLVRAFAEARSREAKRDALANGYALNTCGMEALSNRRDQWGVSSRAAGQWAHAMAVIAFDDRTEIKRMYGDSLELYLNSWNIWNSGSRDIFDSAKYVPANKKQLWISLGIVNAATGNIMIPEGSCWIRSRDVANRDVFAVSSVNGWPRKRLPNWTVGSLIG